MATLVAHGTILAPAVGVPVTVGLIVEIVVPAFSGLDPLLCLLVELIVISVATSVKGFAFSALVGLEPSSLIGDALSG